MGETVKFGTSGLRGLAEALLAGPAERYCMAFCRSLLEAGGLAPGAPVLVGSDNRASSPALRQQVIQSIQHCGLTALDCGAVPTPALAHAAQKRAAAAIMVTGSHIPADRNGLKFYSRGGEISKADETEISRRAALHDEVPAADPPALKTNQGNPNLRDEVLAEWHQRFDGLVAGNAFSGMRIGVLIGSSVATDAMAKLAERHGADVRRFGANDAFEPLDTEAVEPAVLDLCIGQIKDHSLDCVISADPDGDRPLVIGDDGRIVRGDLLGRITADWLGADHLSTTVNANSAIVPSAGMAVSRSRIGSPYVIEAMMRAIDEGYKLPVGFEPNGGFLLGADCTVNGRPLAALMTRDSFLPILSALDAAARHGGKISKAAASYGFNAAASGRLKNVSPARSAALIEGLRDDSVQRAAFFDRFGDISAIDWTDGMRVSLEASSGSRRVGIIMHLRPSGNAPELRCYVEEHSQAAANRLLRACLDAISQKLLKTKEK